MSSELEELASGFEQGVNRHGYGFQQRIAREVAGRGDLEAPEWRVRVLEFPVEVQRRNTRIDLICSHRKGRLVLVGECKRVNPAMARWCFAPWERELQPYDRYNDFFVSALDLSDEASTSLFSIYGDTPSYQVGFEIKSGKKGDSSNSGRGAIEEACTQVLQGVSGLIDLFARSPDISSEYGPERIAVIPVIFTTARLFVSKNHLASASLETGNLEPGTLSIEEVPWLCFHYPQSQSLQHGVSRTYSQHSLISNFYDEYVRPIAIVSGSGLRQFLEWSAWRVAISRLRR